jgi:acetolactate synthase-1/3 small subunit
MSAIVQNRPGVLSHIAEMFSSRGYNIDSLSVNTTEDENISRITVFVEGDDSILEQIRKQLGKIIDVVKVQDFSKKDYVQRESMLIKLSAAPGKRTEIFQIAEVFEGKIVDISETDLMIEATGPEGKIEALIEVLRRFGIKEVARTGCIAMARTPKKSEVKKTKD